MGRLFNIGTMWVRQIETSVYFPLSLTLCESCLTPLQIMHAHFRQTISIALHILIALSASASISSIHLYLHLLLYQRMFEVFR